MKSPIALLIDKKREIFAQYEHARQVEYKPGQLSYREKKDGLPREVKLAMFEEEKSITVDAIKMQLDKYNEAINILDSVEKGTF